MPLDRDDKFSLGAWVQTVSKEQGDILARTESPTNWRGYDLYIEGGRVYFQLVSQGESWLRVGTKQALTLGPWHHVFATYDASSRAEGVKIYVDGLAQELEVLHDYLPEAFKTRSRFKLGQEPVDRNSRDCSTMSASIAASFPRRK